MKLLKNYFFGKFSNRLYIHILNWFDYMVVKSYNKKLVFLEFRLNQKYTMKTQDILLTNITNCGFKMVQKHFV